MTADPSEEPGRPKRRRRRRRRPKGGSTPRSGTVPGGGAGTGSPDEAAPPTTDPAPDVRADAPEAPERDAARDAARADAPSTRRRRRARRGKRPAKRPAIPTTKEVSAGGVVYRRNDDGTLEILLASRRTRRGDLAWGLAKGGIEAGETNEDAALREVREETGIVAEIEEPLGETKYIYVWEDVRIRKTVHFFLMRATGGDPDDRDDEMEEIRWFPMERALKRAAYRGEREVLNRAAELLGS